MAKKERALTMRDINHMLCGGDPNEKGIDRKEKAKRLRKLADLAEMDAKRLREQADAVERGFDTQIGRDLHDAVRRTLEQARGES